MHFGGKTHLFAEKVVIKQHCGERWITQPLHKPNTQGHRLQLGSDYVPSLLNATGGQCEAPFTGAVPQNQMQCYRRQ